MFQWFLMNYSRNSFYKIYYKIFATRKRENYRGESLIEFWQLSLKRHGFVSLGMRCTIIIVYVAEIGSALVFPVGGSRNVR